MADKKNKRPASLGCLFWIAFILLMCMLFFFNKKTISGVLEKTGAANIFSPSKTGNELTATDKNPVEPVITTKETEPVTPGVNTVPAGDGSKEAEPAPETKTKPAEKPATTPVTTPVTKPAPVTPIVKTAPEKTVQNTTQKPAATVVKPVPQRTVSLFFVVIDADGNVIRKEVKRTIPQSDSPLSDTLVALFRGTSSTESGKGMRSLIPAGTKLLSATVRDGVATVNLSEEFQFNQFGIEGYLGQLSQIVFTATSFSTVKSVQFLIEGQRREYLGAEGVWIGTPLSRDKF